MFFIVEDCLSPVLPGGSKEPPCKAGSVTILRVGPSRMLPYWIVDLDDNNLHIALQSFDRLIDMLECIIRGIDDDILPFVPESRRLEIEDICASLRTWIEQQDRLINSYQDRHSLDLNDKAQRKAYALYCQQNGVHFGPAMWPAGDVSDWLANQELTPSFLNRMVKEIKA